MTWRNPEETAEAERAVAEKLGTVKAETRASLLTGLV